MTEPKTVPTPPATPPPALAPPAPPQDALRVPVAIIRILDPATKKVSAPANCITGDVLSITDGKGKEIARVLIEQVDLLVRNPDLHLGEDQFEEVDQTHEPGPA